MAIEQDFLAYHKSIGEELKSSKSRIRHLIGSSHWGTDGGYKESILRKVISDFLPETYRVGTGFVCYPTKTEEDKSNSGQIDILITSKNNPTLFKSGELHFVTSDCAHAIIEVKTKIQGGDELRKVLSKLSDDIKNIRQDSNNSSGPWAGLFIYEQGNLNDHTVLETLQAVSDSDPSKVINCISIGENLFLRFWENGHPISNINPGPVWHSYNLNELSHAYFISNLVSHLSPNFDDSKSQAWFPVEGSKETYKLGYAMLREREPHKF